MTRYLSFLLVFVFVFIAGQPAQAAPTAACAWTGAVDTTWTTPGNWNTCGGLAPGASDTVTIPNVANDPVLDADVTIAGLTVSGGGGILVVNATRLLTINGNATINGTLMANGNVPVSGTYFQNGTLDGTGVLTVTGLLTWDAGLMQGTGRTIVNGGLAHSSGTDTLDTRTLTINGGTVAWSGGSFATANGAKIVSSATWTITTDGDILDGAGATGVFTNTSTIQKTAGVLVTELQLNVRNLGTVSAQVGTLQIGKFSVSTSTSSGVFTVAAGAKLDFQGSHTLDASSSVSGAGTVSFTDSGTTDILGTYNVSGATQSGVSSSPVVNFAIVPTQVGQILVTVGTLSFNAPGSVTATGVTISNGTLNLTPMHLGVSGGYTQTNGTLDGTGTLTVTGLLTWNNGTLKGAGQTLAQGGLSHTTNTVDTLNGRVLRNSGTATWTNGSFTVLNGATIINSGTWSIQTDGDIAQSTGATGYFTNTGTLEKTAGAATSFISMNVYNNGVVNAQTGTLQLGLNTGPLTAAASTGSFAVSSGATLALFGAHALSGATSVSGAGGATFNTGAGATTLAGAYALSTSTQVIAGTVTFNSVPTQLGLLTATAGTLNFVPAGTANATAMNVAAGTVNLTMHMAVSSGYTQTAGLLDGTGTLTVTGTILWNGGTMKGAGRTLALGGVTHNTGSTNTLDGRTLITQGTVLWTNGGFSANNNATILNRGVWDIQTDLDLSVSGTRGVFTNTGTLKKTVGAPAADTQILLNTSNFGTMQALAGTLYLGTLGSTGTHTGTFTVASGAKFDFNGTNAFSASTALSGAGAVHFSTNTSTLNGSYNVTGTTQINSNSTIVTFNSLPTHLGRVNITNGTFTVVPTGTYSATWMNITNGTFSTAGHLVVSSVYTQTAGTLTGAGVVAVSGLMTWNGGTMSGTGQTIANGGLVHASGASGLDTRTFINNSGATWTGGSFSISNKAGILNNSVWDIQTDQDFNGGAPYGTFTNTATLKKTAGTATNTLFNMFVYNTGAFTIYTGTIQIVANMDLTNAISGTVLVKPGATLYAARSLFNQSTGTLGIAKGGALKVDTTFTNNGILTQSLAVNGLSPVAFLRITNFAGALVKYYGVTIESAAGDMGDTLVMIRGNQNCGNGVSLLASVLRCYDVTPTTAYSATITYFYRSAELNGNLVSGVNLYHYIGGGGWQLQNFVARDNSVPEGHYVRANGISSYSPFLIKDNTPTALTLGATSVTAVAEQGALLGAALLALSALGILLQRRRRVA